MAGTRAIKRRINSIDSTSQITRALQMVSASKMSKAQDHARSISVYAQGLYEIVGMLGKIEDSENPYLRKVDRFKRVGILFVGPNRGFVGSLLTNQILALDKFIKKYKQDHEEVDVTAITKHKLAQRAANLLNLNISHHFEEFNDYPGTLDVSSIAQVLLRGFETQEYDEIYICFNSFVNTIIQEPVVKKLLPVDFETQNDQSSNFDFEPSKSRILDELLPEYFQMQILSAVVESNASEHSARMISMKNATDNAHDLKDRLILEYNRSRQAKITSEIMDIIGGTINN